MPDSTQTTPAVVSEDSFVGFEHVTANFIYCPNQFFDVCLPNCSRNVVRVVAYMLLRTLGWLDSNGDPIEQNVRVTFAELIANAGISRGSIRTAIDDAIAAGYISCTQQGRPKTQGDAGQTASYVLRWDMNGEYTSDLKRFQGFYAGEGCRTPIPNTFFKRVVPQERLTVVKVVGTVLRYTVGYQNQFGGRRSQASLSYSYMQRCVNIRDRSSLSEAITLAIADGYIRRVSEGVVNAKSALRQPAAYAVNWRTVAKADVIGSKTRPAASDRFKNPTSIGSKTRPADRFKNPTKEKTDKKDTYKQQAANAAVENLEGFRLLINAGFDKHVAIKLAGSRGAKEIRQQITWLDSRNPDSNCLGLLRTAIEQGWAEPVSVTSHLKKERQAESEQRKAEKDAQHEAEVAARKREIRRRREQMRPAWDRLSAKDRSQIEHIAFERLRSDFDRKRFRNNETYRLNLSLDELRRQKAGSSMLTRL